MIIKIEAFGCKCEVCGHEWISKEEPRRCAKCKARKWDSGATEGSVGVEAAIQPRNGSTAVVRTSTPPNLPKLGQPRDHDPKTCRVYRCWQCIGLGKKF